MVNAGVDRELKVRDKDKKVWSLPNISQDKAKQMLGVFLSPDGNEEVQLEHLTDKAQKWIEFVWVGGLDWSSCWIALKTTIWKPSNTHFQQLLFQKNRYCPLPAPFTRLSYLNAGTLHLFRVTSYMA